MVAVVINKKKDLELRLLKCIKVKRIDRIWGAERGCVNKCWLSKLHISKIHIFISSCEWVVNHRNDAKSMLWSWDLKCHSVWAKASSLHMAHSPQDLVLVNLFLNFKALATTDRGDCMSIPQCRVKIVETSIANCKKLVCIVSPV